MSSMTYRGYTARIELDARENLLWGKVLGLLNEVSITFEGDTVAALGADFHRAIDFYLEDWPEPVALQGSPQAGA